MFCLIVLKQSQDARKEKFWSMSSETPCTRYIHYTIIKKALDPVVVKYGYGPTDADHRQSKAMNRLVKIYSTLIYGDSTPVVPTRGT